LRNPGILYGWKRAVRTFLTSAELSSSDSWLGKGMIEFNTVQLFILWNYVMEL